MAVRTWGRVISLIMRDKEETALSVEELMKTNTTSITSLGTSTHTKMFNMENRLKQDIRNQVWFEAAAIKLSGSVQLLEKIRSHSHFRVKLEFIENINLILINCIR